MKTCRALSLVMLCVFAAASARGQSAAGVLGQPRLLELAIRYTF